MYAEVLGTTTYGLNGHVIGVEVDIRRAAEAGIGEAEDRALRITESIGEGRTGVREAERAAQQLEDAGERAGEVIAESQRILSGIRERAEKEE